MPEVGGVKAPKGWRWVGLGVGLGVRGWRWVGLGMVYVRWICMVCGSGIRLLGWRCRPHTAMTYGSAVLQSDLSRLFCNDNMTRILL